MKSPATDLACLAFVIEAPASGYDIFKASRAGSLRFAFKASQATIYDSLRRLEARGAVSPHRLPQDGRPAKIVYPPPPAGRKLAPQLARALLRQVPEGQHLRLLVRFAGLVPPTDLDSALEARKARLGQEIAEVIDIESGLQASEAKVLAAFRNVFQAEQAQLAAMAEYVRGRGRG